MACCCSCSYSSSGQAASLVRPVLLRRAQHPGQNAGHLFVAGRSHRHHRPVGLPHRIGREEVQMGSQLELTSEPLSEADAGARQRARRAMTPGLAALPVPHHLHQAHFQALEQLWLLDDVEANREGQTQRPLSMRHARQQRRQVDARVQRATGGTRGAPTPVLATERDDSRLGAGLAGDLHEAEPRVTASEVALHLQLHPRRHRARHLGPAPSEGLVQH